MNDDYMISFQNETKQTIEASYKKMTAVERSVADFFIGNKDDMDFSSKNISRVLYVSEATLSRFSQKCGYKGYREFIFSYERDLKFEQKSEGTEKDVGLFARRVQNSYQKLLQENFRILDEEQVRRVAGMLNISKRVLIFGIGNSGYAAEEFQLRFMRIGMDVNAVTDSHMMKIGAALAGEETLVIAITLSGETAEVLESIRIAKSRGASIICITAVSGSSVAKESQEVIRVAALKNLDTGTKISPQFSILAIMDLIILQMILTLKHKNIRQPCLLFVQKGNTRRIKMNKKKYIGIDIGGTAVKIGSVDEDGTIHATETYAVNFDGYETPILQTVVKSCHNFLEKYRENASEYAGIGVSATGAISTKKGVVEGTAGHIKNWINSPIRQVMEQEFHIPTEVLNDANAAALGEAWIGAAKGKKDVVVVTIGTGVGGGILMNGKILLGASGFAGELGHIPVQYEGEMCTCGNRGCLEHYGSTSALVRKVRWAIQEGAIAGAADTPVDGRWIFAQATTGNVVVQKILQEWIEVIASALVGFVHMFNPEQILIGGGVSAQEDLFIAPVRSYVMKHVMPNFAKDLEICAAALKNEAGMVGAVYYCIQQERECDC